MFWAAFEYRGKTYDLCHLHPRRVEYVREAKGDKPTFTYKVDVTFSLHCFTHGCKDIEPTDSQLFYSDDRETRVFDFERWRLSHYLPAIIDGLMQGQCFHTQFRNYLRIQILEENNQAPAHYEIYFEVTRPDQKGPLKLFIQSAYVRERPDKRRHNLPIKFSFILHNTLNRIPIRAPK